MSVYSTTRKYNLKPIFLRCTDDLAEMWSEYTGSLRTSSVGLFFVWNASTTININLCITTQALSSNDSKRSEEITACEASAGEFMSGDFEIVLLQFTHNTKSSSSSITNDLPDSKWWKFMAISRFKMMKIHGYFQDCLPPPLFHLYF